MEGPLPFTSRYSPGPACPPPPHTPQGRGSPSGRNGGSSTMSTDGPRHNYERRCDRIPIFAARPPDSFVFICASPASGNLMALFSTALVRDFPAESPTIQYRTSPDSRCGPDTQADVCRPDHPGPNSDLSQRELGWGNCGEDGLWAHFKVNYTLGSSLVEFWVW